MVDKDYIRVAKEILIYGNNKTISYDINEEIIWNRLFVINKSIEKEDIDAK